MDSHSACRVCGERDHVSSHCSDLHDVTKEGFYSGGGGGGGHSHDDEEETIQMFKHYYNLYIKWKIPLKLKV